jgi:phage N-6-adenine-methyltransferase
MSVHFSSESNEWATPAELFDSLDREFEFTLDPCSTDENAKCARHFTAEYDGLAQDWSQDRVFMNPPYGRQIGRWMAKAYQESRRGATVACLIPARTDTSYWHDYAMKGEIRFLRGRQYFIRADGKTGRAPFPSAVVVFRPPTDAIK